MRGWFLTLCLAGGLTGIGAAVQPTALAGITIVSKPLGLEFSSPDGWRLGKESTAEELLLYGHDKKASPLLRIRAFAGRLSPSDRLPEMKRGLSKGEGQVTLKSSMRWQQDGHRFETARATVKVGSAEYLAIFTLVDHPKKRQHGFWLYGRAKDVEKQWPAIQAAIASARSTAATTSLVDSAQESAPLKKVKAAPVWSDPKTGLGLGRWPAGFVLDPKTEHELSNQGLRLSPSDERAHPSTGFLIRATGGQKAGTYQEGSDALKAELETNPKASSVRQVSLRVAGVSSSRVGWKVEAAGGPLTHESYFVQQGPTLFRIDFTAGDSWARSRSRRNLVRDFIADIRL